MTPLLVGGCLWATEGIVDAFQAANITIKQRIEYVRNNLPQQDIDSYLTMLKLLSRSKYICNNPPTHPSFKVHNKI